MAAYVEMEACEQIRIEQEPMLCWIDWSGMNDEEAKATEPEMATCHPTN